MYPSDLAACGYSKNWIVSEISDLRVTRRCGLHEWERYAERPNLLLVSVRMYSEYTGDPSLHIDYDPVRASLAEWPTKEHVDTLEELVEELLPLLFANPMVLACWVKISKPLIFSEARSAGIEVFRWRDSTVANGVGFGSAK